MSIALVVPTISVADQKCDLALDSCLKTLDAYKEEVNVLRDYNKLLEEQRKEALEASKNTGGSTIPFIIGGFALGILTGVIVLK